MDSRPLTFSELPSRLRKRMLSSSREVTREDLDELDECGRRHWERLVTLYYVMELPWEVALEQCSKRAGWLRLCRKLCDELRRIAHEDPVEARRLRDVLVARVDEVLVEPARET